MPVKCAGTRIEPPPSLPIPPADSPRRSPRTRRRWIARRASESPRAVGAAVQRVVGLLAHELLGDVGDAEHDRAGGAQPATRVASVSPRMPARKREPVSKGSPATEIALLMLMGTPNNVLRAGYPVPSAVPGRVHACRALGRACVGQRAIRIEADVGVERGFVRVDACERRLHQFLRRDFLRARRARHFGCSWRRRGWTRGTVYLKCRSAEVPWCQVPECRSAECRSAECQCERGGGWGECRRAGMPRRRCHIMRGCP